MRIQTKTYLLAWIALATGIIASTPARAADGEARRFYSAVPGGGDRTMDYEVKEGDTLFHIAERFLGSPYRRRRIREKQRHRRPVTPQSRHRIKVPAVEASILYSIEKLTPAGEFLQYGGNDAMSAGDRFFVRISANADGYLICSTGPAMAVSRASFPLPNARSASRRSPNTCCPPRGPSNSTACSPTKRSGSSWPRRRYPTSMPRSIAAFWKRPKCRHTIPPGPRRVSSSRAIRTTSRTSWLACSPAARERCMPSRTSR